MFAFLVCLDYVKSWLLVKKKCSFAIEAVVKKHLKWAFAVQSKFIQGSFSDYQKRIL